MAELSQHTPGKHSSQPPTLAVQSRTRSPVARWTTAAVVTWLAMLAVLAALALWAVHRPNPLFLLAPLCALLVCTCGVCSRGIQAIVKDPRRGRTTATLALGVSPLLITAAVAGYGLKIARGNRPPPRALIWLGEPAAVMLLDAYVRVQYPYRHERGRFVMWSRSSRVNPRHVAEMEAHIGKMERLLGNVRAPKIDWVRGPAWGIHGRSWRGWALGSQDSIPSRLETPLAELDRHETAHAALHQAARFSVDLPTFLDEGWAECQSGANREHDLDCAKRALDRGLLLTLRDLAGADLFRSHDTAVYWHGCAVVDYLLRRFGSKKLAHLCRDCRQATFESDVQRVLGVTMDELDRAFRADLAARPSPDRRFLLSLPLARYVQTTQWRKFVDQYVKSAEQLRHAYDRSTVRMVRSISQQAGDETTRLAIERTEYYYDGPRRARIRSWQPAGRCDARIATPGRSFCLAKDSPDGPWMAATPPDDTRCAYLDTWLSLSDDQFLEAPLDLLDDQLRDFNVTVTHLGRSPKTPRRLRIEIDAHPLIEGKPLHYAGWWDVDPDFAYAVVESRFETKDSQGAIMAVTRSRTVLQRRGAAIVPKRTTHERAAPTGRILRTDEIESVDFAAPEPGRFRLGAYLP